MTPFDLRAAAERIRHSYPVNAAGVYQQAADERTLADAALRLADVIEYAERMPYEGYRGEAVLDQSDVLRIARGGNT